MQMSMTGKVGTPVYMAPELYDDDEEHYRPAVDVYAFAMMAYEIVTGKEPFSENGKPLSFANLSKKILMGDRPGFIEGITENMIELIQKCWSQNPKERPSFEYIFERLSNDFSYSDETVDEEEIILYIEKLEKSREKSKIEKQMSLQTELDKMKSENQSYKDLLIKNEEEKRRLQIELDEMKILYQKLKESNQTQIEKPSDPSSMYKCMHVKICKACKISKQFFGKSQTSIWIVLYRRLRRGYKTKEIANNSNPVWNEEFDFVSKNQDDVLYITMHIKNEKGNNVMDQI